MTDTTDLVERLRATRPISLFSERQMLGLGADARQILVNPDGPEAATLLESLSSSVAEVGFFWKWIERGIFDADVPANTALNVLANHPSAPWKKGRWDVDHKAYAEMFYELFPNARAALAQPVRGD